MELSCGFCAARGVGSGQYRLVAGCLLHAELPGYLGAVIVYYRRLVARCLVHAELPGCVVNVGTPDCLCVRSERFGMWIKLYELVGRVFVATGGGANVRPVGMIGAKYIGFAYCCGGPRLVGSNGA